MSVLPGAPLPFNPIYNIAPELLITGALRGHTIFVTGSQSGELFKYDYTGSSIGQQSIPMINSPRPGEYIVVHQCETGGDISTCSHQSNSLNNQVLSEPNPLPVPIVTNPMHSCADGIGLSNLIPGARVFARLHPQNEMVLDEQVKSRTSGYYHLKDGIEFSPGSTLEIWQSTKEQESPHLDPFSTVLVTPYTNPLDEVKFWLPALCANSITLDNMLNGASVTVYAPECEWTGTFSSDDPARRSYTITPACPKIDLWTKPGRFAVYQTFSRCDLKSPVSNANIEDIPVTLTVLDVPIPRLNLVCSGTTTISVLVNQLLYPPALMKITRYVGDEVDDAFWWPIQSAGEITLDLPYPWTQPDTRGPVSFDFILALDTKSSPCQDVLSTKSYSEFIGHRLSLDTSEKASAANPPTLYPNTVYECGKVLQLRNGYIGSEVQVQDTNGAVYSDWITVKEKLQQLDLFRSLTADTVVIAIVRGCGSKRDSNTIKVVRLQELQQPRLEAPRPGDTQIVASEIAPGATVSVFIDDGQNGPSRFNSEGQLWGADQVSSSETISFRLRAPLKGGYKVNLVQALCSKKSPNEPAQYTTVNRATLAVTVDSNPPPLKKDQQYGIHVHAVDAGKPWIKDDPRLGKVTLDTVSGQFSLGSYLQIFVPRNSPLTKLEGQVLATEYNEAAYFSIALTGAAPSSIEVNLVAFGNGFRTFLFPTQADPNPVCTYSLSSIHFIVSPDWSGNSLQAEGSLIGAQFVTSVAVPFPTGGGERSMAISAKATYVTSQCDIVTTIEDVPFFFNGYIGDSRTSGSICIKWNVGFRYIPSGDDINMVRKWDLDSSSGIALANPGFSQPTC